VTSKQVCYDISTQVVVVDVPFNSSAPPPIPKAKKVTTREAMDNYDKCGMTEDFIVTTLSTLEWNTKVQFPVVPPVAAAPAAGPP